MYDTGRERVFAEVCKGARSCSTSRFAPMKSTVIKGASTSMFPDCTSCTRSGHLYGVKVANPRRVLDCCIFVGERKASGRN